MQIADVAQPLPLGPPLFVSYLVALALNYAHSLPADVQGRFCSANQISYPCQALGYRLLS